jgi:hypothetical protein
VIGEGAELMVANGHASEFTYDRFDQDHGKFIKVEPIVMFIDIVGFTKKGSNTELRDVVRRLQENINDTFEDIKWDEEEGPNQAIMLPTGDGYGIGFEKSIDSKYVLKHAVELSNKLRDSESPVRIGINKGPCWRHFDLNNKLNLAGWGIIDAARAMACGRKNHIICTDRLATTHLEIQKDANMHQVGRFGSKGRKLILYNYYSNRFGNSARPVNR